MSGSTKVRRPSWLLATAVVVAMFALMRAAAAHEIRPAYLQIDQSGTSRYSVLWRTPLLSGMRLPVVLQFPDGVRNITEPTERELPDSLVERRIIETAETGLAGGRIEFVGLQGTITDVLVRVQMLDGSVSTTLVRPSNPWIEIAAAHGSLEIAKTFVVHGIEHILFGFDHLLFVASLMLIVRSWRMLVKTITAFTVAHSITLTLAALGWVTLPSAPVEAMIAFSILLVATEFLKMERGQSSLTTAWPWAVAFAFGLLHGFGFAGALTDLGLPEGDLPLALLSFNIGVETGQLMFIAVILGAVHSIRRIYTIPRRAILASAYAIGTVAAFWTVERMETIFL
jgi:hydrogenase/urease accessory protein HupE